MENQEKIKTIVAESTLSKEDKEMWDMLINNMEEQELSEIVELLIDKGEDLTKFTEEIKLKKDAIWGNDEAMNKLE